MPQAVLSTEVTSHCHTGKTILIIQLVYTLPTKKANEMMAHTYSHNYQLPATGLRFFTVRAMEDQIWLLLYLLKLSLKENLLM